MNKMKLIRIFAKNSLLTGRKPLWARMRRLLWAAALLLPAFAVRADVVFTNLYSFTGTNNGANPQAALVQGSDGFFYGTTYGGGAYTNQYGVGCGTVFKINTNGWLTSLYPFGSIQDTNGNPLDGGNPQAALVQGSDGYFYGTTYSGGTNLWSGTVFKISTNGVLTTLYSFTGGNDGANPQVALVQGSDGYFYGTTPTEGGPFGLHRGTVFKISTNGTLNTLYSSPGDYSGSSNGLFHGRDGNFYGSTSGLSYRCYFVGFLCYSGGAVFAIPPMAR